MAIAGREQQREEHRIKRLWTRRIIFAFFVFIGLVVLLESPLTRIRHISVAGNQGVDTSAVVGASGLHSGMSLFQVNKSAVTARILNQEPLVQSVSVKVDFPSGKVALTIHQKTIVAATQVGNSFYELLNDGTVFRKVPLQSLGNIPLLQVSSSAKMQVGQVPGITGLKALCEQVAKLPASSFQTISQISLDNFGDATVYFENGFAAQVSASSFSQTLVDVPDVILYFTKQGYGPGLIDMTGQPPYRYTPFQASPTKAGQH